MTDSEPSSGWVTEEEEDVVVKLSGTIPEELLDRISNSAQPKCSYMGLDGEAPVIQLGNELFRGHYSFTPGTNIILEESDTVQTHPHRPADVSLSLLTSTDKQLDMKKLYVQEKVTTTSGAANSDSTAATRGETEMQAS